MATRLTKEMRNDITEAVMKATILDAKEESIKKRCSELATAIVTPKIPVDLLEAVTKYPRPYFMWISSISISSHSNPLKELGNGARWNPCVDLVNPVPHGSDHYSMTDAEHALFEPLTEEAKTLAEMRTEMIGEMNAFLRSCSTVEKVLERMPELAPYIPKAEGYFPIVPSTANLLSGLLKQGFVVQPAAHA